MALDKNQIHQGDCVKQLAKVTEGSVDLVFADPPFNIGYSYDVYDDSQSTDDYVKWCREWIDGVYRALKPDGTFWLAIGDEYAAELKIESQKAGFHCRSWVIWYYTFGVNCANGFSRSHTHLFHFVKDKKNFTFVRPNPNVRVKSARQLVYADLRANPSGRLPDNTWITRPQDAPHAFRPIHDTWFYSRVAGTFKEREGFHGCQMPEQLLARIIRTSSHPYDLVLDPFGGSGTTLCVAKKLRRNWIGFELSKDYVRHIKKRLDNTQPGDPLDGPEDPIESAPATSRGKKRPKKSFDEDTINAVIESYKLGGDGFPADFVLCDKDLNKKFIKECLKRGIGGNAIVWNHLMLRLRKAGRLPKSTRNPKRVRAEDVNRYGYASEVAWRLVSDEFSSETSTYSLDDILCCPDSAEYFDQVAKDYGPQDLDISPLQYRRAAIAIRKMTLKARLDRKKKQESMVDVMDAISESDDLGSIPSDPGLFLISGQGVDIFVGEADNVREQVESIIGNPKWESLLPSQFFHVQKDAVTGDKYELRSALVETKRPILNPMVWFAEPIAMAI